MHLNWDVSKPDNLSYPRLYRVTLGWRIFMYSFGTIVAIGGLVGMWYLGAWNAVRGAEEVSINHFLCAAFFLFGLFAVVDTIKSKVVLHAEAIELHDLMPARRLARSEIKGRRLLNVQRGTPVIHLLPIDSKQKKIKIPQMFETDRAFQAWIASIADFDAEDVRRFEAGIAKNPDLGATPEERTQRNASAQRVAKALQVIALVVGALGWFYPHPYALVIWLIVSLPWVAFALMILYKGVYQGHGRRDDMRPDLAVLLLMPGVVLAFRALYDIQLVDWRHGVQMAVVGGIVFAVLISYVDRTSRSKPHLLLLSAILMAAYGYGAGSLTNSLLDTAKPQIFETKVLGKYIPGRKGANNYLRVAGWNGKLESVEIPVSRSFYHAVKTRDVVCVSLHAGAFNVPWYSVGPCER